jgi:hypothetical protein
MKPQVIFVRNYSSELNEYDDNYETDKTDFQLDELAVKALSYNQSSDPVIQNLNNCTNIQELLQLTNILKDKRHYVHFLLLTGKFRNPQEPTVLLDSIKFTDNVNNFISGMSSIEMGVTLLYLRLLGIDSTQATSRRKETVLTH